MDYRLLIATLRGEGKMTLAQIAEEGHFSVQSLINWINGVYTPNKASQEELLKVAENHGIEPSQTFLDLTGISQEQKEVLKNMRDCFLKSNQEIEVLRKKNR